MIIKSMSRKTESFGQLVSYMNSEKSDDRYDLYHHCFSRDQNGLVLEFEANASHLKQRKNGNIMYHEILSFSIEDGVDRKVLKEGLRDAAFRYVSDRCPDNMVYGCLHDDHKDHVHYHLLLSANMKGESKRLRLTRKELSNIKKNAEIYVLTQHPEFKQMPSMTEMEKRADKEKLSNKAAAMKARTGDLPERDRVLETLRTGISECSSMDDFVSYLSEKNFGFYTRGKNFGVQTVQENGKIKKYRFSTLGIHDDFVAFQNDVVSDWKQKAQQEAQALKEKDQAEKAEQKPQKKDKAQRHDQNMTHLSSRKLLPKEPELMRNHQQKNILM
jgi:hypothetical protein